MNHSPHTLRNDADASVSLVGAVKTVGNLPKSVQGGRQIQILERDDDFALGRMWSSFIRQASRDVANLPKPLPKPQISLYGSYYGTLILNTESGEGVVSSGEVVEALDYYPYGVERIHSGSSDADRTFIGQFGDDPTALSYLNARYYDPARAGFLSQDPVFLAVGDPRAVSGLAQQAQEKVLADPQLLNSYSYARGNPITLKDPEGKLAFLPFAGFALTQYGAAKFGVAAGYDLSVNYGPYSNVFSDAEKSRARFGTVYEFGTIGLSAYAAANNMKGAAFALDSLGAGLDTGDTYFGEVIYERYNRNHEGEQEGPFKTAKELKPTVADKARYKIGLMGSGPMSSANSANAGAVQSQNNRSQSYAQSVAAWTKIRDGLLGAVKKLQASRQ